MKSNLDFLKQVKVNFEHNINHFMEKEPESVKILDIHAITNDIFLQDLYIESKIALYSNLTNCSAIVTWALIDYVVVKLSGKDRSMKQAFEHLEEINKNEVDENLRAKKETIIAEISNQRLKNNVRNNLLHTDTEGYLEDCNYGKHQIQNDYTFYAHVIRHNKHFYGRIVNDLIETYRNDL